MTIYLVILAVIGFFSFIIGLSPSEADSRARLQAGFSTLISLLLILVLALRHPTIGVDVREYVNHWSLSATNNLFEISRFEPAFVGLIELSRIISGSSQFFLVLVAVLSIAPVAYAIRKGSEQQLLSWIIYICLGFYAFTFSGLRQAIAMAFTTLALQFIRKRKLVPFLLTVGLACTFHYSALIFLPSYWIYKIKIRPIIFIIYASAVPLIYVFRERIFNSFIAIFYPDYEVAHSEAYTWLLISVVIISISWFLLAHRDINGTTLDAKNDAEGLLKITTIGVTFMLFASVGTNVMRMADYYYIVIAFALPAVLNVVSSKIRIPAKIYLVSAFIGIYVLQMMQSPYNIVPYRIFVD